VAALGAAVIIAVELTAEHWFYLYIPWFFALLLTGLVATTSRSSSAMVTPGSVTSAAPGLPRERIGAASGNEPGHDPRSETAGAAPEG
jgi:hypothetical protein